MHTPYYRILRPCLWFAVGDKVPYSKFQEYFTPKAIRSLIKNKMIQIVFHDESKKGEGSNT